MSAGTEYGIDAGERAIHGEDVADDDFRQEAIM